MQWQFRKALESFEGYKRSVTFRNQIQNGDESTLDVVVREIELILSDKNEKIILKVLAMRFARDIMILGQEEVVRRVEKLAPFLTKICSHDLNSPDPDRGQTYFHDHPAYQKATDEDERKEIETLGSTFLILSLQSILHWAKWIPLDSNGKQSIYAKAYQSLVDRKVVFPTSFHYYKQSDTEKFKNMYKMEFFTDSYESAYSETPSEVQQSQVSEVELRQNRSGWEKKSKIQEVKQLQSSEEYTGQARNLRTVAEILDYLTELKSNKTRKMGVLRQINKNVQDLYQIQTGLGRLAKTQKKWIQNFIIGFSLLNSNLIDYNQFLKRSLSEQVVIELGIQEQDITINKDVKQTPMKPYHTPGKEGSKVKNQGSRIGSQINKRQEYQYKLKINTLAVQLEEKNNQVSIIRSNFQKEKHRIIDDYQSRIALIKTQVKKGQQDRGAFERELQKQNQKLRAKVSLMEEQLSGTNYNDNRERDLQSERNHLLTKVKRLQLQNDKLQQIKAVSKTYDKQVVSLQLSLKQKEGSIESMRAQLRKFQKMCQNHQDEANLYKSQLINQRAKHEQRMNTLSKNKEILQGENKSVKQKVLQYRKTLDVKELEVINLREEIKRYQNKIKDINDKRPLVDNQKSDHWTKSRTAMPYQSPGRMPVPSSPEVQPYTVNVYSGEKKPRFNNYDDLYNELKPNNRQLFIRLCRCGLKKKDILLKENQVQIGIITEVISQYKLKFILHFTNTSQKQVENLKIEFNMGNSYVSTLEYSIQNKYIFCIQPQEQEKVIVSVTNKEPPFLKERAILQVSFQYPNFLYRKNGASFSNNIFLPFLIPKFFDFYRPKALKVSDRAKNPRQHLQFRYNKKMLPKANSLKSYFQQIEQMTPNKYQLDAFHRQTDLTIKLIFILTHDTQSMQLQALVLREKINDKQRYAFQELVSFLEIAFKK